MSKGLQTVEVQFLVPSPSGAGQLPVRPRPRLPKCMSLPLSLLVGVAVDVAVADGYWLNASAGFTVCDADAAAAEADARGLIASDGIACSCTKFWSLGL